ncbi:DUF4271 domain-containing protein [Aquimarina sp. AD10]|uniref:DUF4271 domain-containing protein n=1 Tax=Aquimarina sp. AD10 TaxID=1714849 RepID=UPI000E51D435|nr:DUF4271 domain-containing protein [Aquimarina sp. AD10]RKM90559.1 DUF4271 domain-containing protein [Aquimarina sp. AD10]
MEFITREITSNNWLTILLVLCLALLAIAKKLDALKFADFMTLFTSTKYIISSQKTSTLSSPFNTILLILQIISVSLFLYSGFEAFEFEVLPIQINLFFKIIILYTVIVICKLLVEKIVATIFSIDSIIDEYLFHKVSYRNFIGVLLLPINIIFIYAFLPTRNVFIAVLALLFIINAIVLISFYKKNENTILKHLFYFILYLCALEIAPYFILYKLIK